MLAHASMLAGGDKFRIDLGKDVLRNQVKASVFFQCVQDIIFHSRL